MSNLAKIGHNNPPTPFDEAESQIEMLYGEAKHWLDGAVADSQEYADKLALLLDSIRKAKNKADAARKEEKRPHDEAGKAVQARYKPLLDRCDLIASGCKKALTPWLEKLEAEQRAKAEAARLEAERARQEAEAKVAAARYTSDLEASEEREAAIEEAKRAEAAAARAERSKAHAKGGGRAIGIRTRKVATMTDRREAARHFWTIHPDRFESLLQSMADEAIRQGATEIPGFDITEERIAQ